MKELERLIDSWLTLPDVADELGIDVGKVRRLVQDRKLVEIRRGDPKVRSVPAEFLKDGEPVAGLAGTVTVLSDAGYSDEELLVWLFTEDDSLPGTPIGNLRQGHKSEIRRRAQALAF